MPTNHPTSGREPYDILIRAVGQGIREVYGTSDWTQVESKAEGLWARYAGSTGLAWSEGGVRVRRGWKEAGVAAQ